jgi:uncharacterized alkaline shock family protein YloU
MTYNFELDISTSVKAENVEAMIKNIVETQTGRKVDSINVRYNDTTFDGYDVRFQTEVASVQTVKKNSILDKTFKPFKWDQQ